MSGQKISLSNICALACDNVQVMVGNRSSFKTKLKEKSPRLIVFPCVSHSSTISAKYANKRTAIFRSIVLELGNVNFADPSNQKPLQDIDVGKETREYFQQQLTNKKLQIVEVDLFLRNCLKFYITASE